MFFALTGKHPEIQRSVIQIFDFSYLMFYY